MRQWLQHSFSRVPLSTPLGGTGPALFVCLLTLNTWVNQQSHSVSMIVMLEEEGVWGGKQTLFQKKERDTPTQKNLSGKKYEELKNKN